MTEGSPDNFFSHLTAQSGEGVLENVKFRNKQAHADAYFDAEIKKNNLWKRNNGIFGIS
ncbi:MAG: hypothetical protein LUQ54_00405 [Methanoregula sp.]|nr:hypothetical protein [Methanoregula sp.]